MGLWREFFQLEVSFKESFSATAIFKKEFIGQRPMETKHSLIKIIFDENKKKFTIQPTSHQGPESHTFLLTTRLDIDIATKRHIPSSFDIGPNRGRHMPTHIDIKSQQTEISTWALLDIRMHACTHALTHTHFHSHHCLR